MSCLNIGPPQSSVCLEAGFTMLVSYNFLDDLLGYKTESQTFNSTLRGLNDTLEENLDSNSTPIGEEQLDTEAVSRR